jgi:hypothetical protein
MKREDDVVLKPVSRHNPCDISDESQVENPDNNSDDNLEDNLMSTQLTTHMTSLPLPTMPNES